VISRRRFLNGVVMALAPLGAAADAQEHKAGKVSRVGYLTAGAGSENLTYLNAFRQGLRDLGYVVGRGIAIEYRWGEGKYERLSKLADEFVHLF
jgi:putative ABC transport system substrate-binding protein